MYFNLFTRLPRTAFSLVFAFVGSISQVAQAAELTEPTYFKVNGVANDDVLNVRTGAGSANPIVGHLGPNARPVEVFETKSGWGRIVYGEGKGWVSLRYLKTLSLPKVSGTKLPEGMMCVGAEPFWSLEFQTPLKLRLDTVGQGSKTLTVAEAGAFQARPNADYIWAVSEETNVAISVRRTLCSDGMSDRDYPMAVELISRSGGNGFALQGCCYTPLTP